MSPLTRRIHALLDEERYERLKRRAAETSKSIGALVTEAVDIAYPERAMGRSEALAALRSAPRLDHGDVEQVERDIASRHNVA